MFKAEGSEELDVIMFVRKKQGKKVCKVTALRCYQCSRLRFLLAKANWLIPKKKLHGSVVNCAGAQ